MNNTLAKKFTFTDLIRFALPNIIMMVFFSMYTIVDGIFVSKYVGTTALSSVNMIYPATNLQLAIAIMLATGGSAIIAFKLGAKREEEARQNFSLILLIEFLIGVLFGVIGNIFIKQIVGFLGASEVQFELCVTYGRILFTFAPFFFLQTAFQILFVTAGKPNLGLIATVAGGIANMVLDYLFMGILNSGIAGAAIATGMGYSIPAIIGLIYFVCLKRGTLYFTKPTFDKKMLRNATINGSSEMVTNLANSVSTYMFNYLFLKFYGEDGVASITIVLYFQFIFTAIFIGYSLGVAPVISYKQGSNNTKQLKDIIRNSMIFIIVCSGLAYGLSFFIVNPITKTFAQETSNVYKITIEGFPIFAIAFLMMGINIYVSAMFTALSDGRTSALISFARTLVFLISGLAFLPIIFGKFGLWIAVPVAEFLGMIISIVFFAKYKRKYQY